MPTYPLPASERQVVETNCRWCGKELRDKRRSYCNAEHRDSWINDIYLNENFKLQRQLAFKRDMDMCQKCKITKQEHWKKYRQSLHAHHIVPRHEGGSNHRDNLLTLCRNCHIELHKEMAAS